MLQGKKTSENHRFKGYKKAMLIYLLEAEPMMRIVVPPSHRYQALLAVFAHGHWRVQHTMQQVKKIFYWPGWRKDMSFFVTECACCQRKGKFKKC